MHISDLHLGKIINGYSMVEDQKYILQQVLNIVEQSQIDVFVIAGDIYDRAIAPVDAVELWSDFLIKLSKLNLHVLIINGNHDSIKRLGYASELLVTNKIHIVSQHRLWKQIKIDEVNFYLLPFISLEQASHLCEERITSFTQLKTKIINQIELNPKQKNIIIDHSYIITGSNDIETDSSVRPLSLGQSEFTDGAVYADFDLVLAGHIHRHSHMQPNIYYSGSILPYSVGERNNKNGYYIFDLDNGCIGDYNYFDLLHPMREVALYIENIDKQTYSEDYVIVKLLNEGQVVNPLEKIRAKFPNVMQIDRNFRQLEITSIENKNLSTVDAFTEFYNMNSEKELSDEALDIFKTLVQKIEGETDETY